MKYLKIQAKIKILIVDTCIKCDITVTKDGIYFYHSDNTKHNFIKGDFRLISDGFGLTEEIITGLVPSMNFGTDKNIDIGYYSAKKNNYSCSSALESFISFIEAQGWYWNNNPVTSAESYNKALNDQKAWDKRRYSQKRLYLADTPTYKQQMKCYNEAEAKTLHSDRIFIFKILDDDLGS